MTERTLRMIERMKKQTFGVEIECNGITRKKAAETAAVLFRAEEPVRLFYRRGYDCRSVRDPLGREWKFEPDSSIHGPRKEQCEIITPVLRYEDMELLQRLVRCLRKAGAKSSPSRGCGVHIHIGVRCETGDHNARTLRNLVNIMASHEQQLARAIRLDRARQSTYCRTVDPVFLGRVNRRRPQTMEELANIWYEAHESMYNREVKYNKSRYHMLNLHTVFTRGTIEFRLFQFDEPDGTRKGGLHAGELKAYVQLCLAICERARKVRCASSRPQQTDNEKYAMSLLSSGRENPAGGSAAFLSVLFRPRFLWWRTKSAADSSRMITCMAAPPFIPGEWKRVHLFRLDRPPDGRPVAGGPEKNPEGKRESVLRMERSAFPVRGPGACAGGQPACPETLFRHAGLPADRTVRGRVREKPSGGNRNLAEPDPGGKIEWLK